MKMQTNFELMDELMVAPTPGLDVVRGMVRIVAVTVFEGLPSDMDGESFLTEDAAYDAELLAGAWYGFRYLNDSILKDMGVMYLPEDLFETIISK